MIPNALQLLRLNNAPRGVMALSIVIFTAGWSFADEPVAPPDEDLGPEIVVKPSDAHGFAPAAAGPTNALGGAWVSQGPGPTRGGQVENISPNNEVVGAVNAVAPHPTDVNTLFVGGGNGGVWRTRNATAASPTWTPLTDQLASMSIGALAFDLLDPAYNTVWAGIGRFSSFGRAGGRRTGLQRTTDGGDSWTEVNGGGLLTGKNIAGIVARSNVIVVAVNTSDAGGVANSGIFRSVNFGTTFTQVSSGNGAATGLPGGAAYDLSGDPSDLNVIYTSLTQADTVGGVNGIYRSANGGATWTRISNATIEALISSSTTSNMRMNVSPQGVFYIGILNSGRLAGVFRTANGGGAWQQMDIPLTNENGTDVGINPNPKGDGDPGGQGSIHFSIAADPANTNVVYVGGDRQPTSNGDTGGFPNSIGAFDYSGRLFRGDASRAPGSQWVHLTHSRTLGAAGGGTLNSTAPHADSRDMAFDASGNLIEGDDGGVYRRTSPANNLGDWFSIIGNLAVTELHDVAYDGNANVCVGGAQDTGSPRQISPNASPWQSVSTADGGDVAVDTISTPGVGVQYTSFQNLGSFRRRTYNAANGIVSTVFPALTLTNGIGPFRKLFVTPVRVNAVDGRRLVFGSSSNLYETFDQGNNISEIVLTNGINSTAMAYGGRKAGVTNADVLYAGSSSRVFLRTNAGGLMLATAYAGGTPRDIALHPDDWMTAYVIDSDQVFVTANAGVSWNDVTGNLAGVAECRAVRFIRLGGANAIAVGTQDGVFASLLATLGTWVRVGSALPSAPVYDLDFDPADEVLVAGTLGRGAWKLSLGQITGTPELVVQDATVIEGNAGTNFAVFSIALSFGASTNVSVRYATASGNALSGVDFLPRSGLAEFAPGQTLVSVSVPVLGDTLPEPNEVFFLNLTNATNAVLLGKQGAGTIIDNDNPPVVSITSPLNATVFSVGAEVTISATAIDADNGVTQVEFLSGASSIGTVVGAPFNLTISNLTAGSYELRAVATDTTGLKGTSAPVNITVSPGAAQTIPLISFTGNWRYDATTNDFGAAWTNVAYAEPGWLGPSPGLLYNESAALLEPKSTLLPLTFNTARIRGFYFRTHFNFPTNPGAGVTLVSSNLIDDGAVFWLNGMEVGRLRMSGVPVRTTLADSTPPPNGDATNYEVLNFSTNALVQGDNVLAVEVHQQSDTSSDMVFGMRLDARLGFAPTVVDPTQPTNRTVLQGRSSLLALGIAGSAPLTYRWFKDGVFTSATAALALINMAPGNAGSYFCIVSNSFGTVTSRTAVVSYAADAAGPQLVEAIGAMNGTSIIVTFSEPVTASAANPANYQVLSAAGSLAILGAAQSNNTTVILTTAPRMQNVNYTLVVNNVQDPYANVIAADSAVIVATELVLLVGDNQIWNYHQSNTDPGTGWPVPGFCDVVEPWTSGPALFDAKRPAGRTLVGPNNEPVRTMLNLTNPPAASEISSAYYFRTHFQLSGPAAGVRLRLRPLVDDGAVFYLNGAEVHRVRMETFPIPINYGSFATVAQGDTDNIYEPAIDLPADRLVAGDNVFAAEVHQANLGSSDLSFAAQLVAVLPLVAETPRLFIVRSGNTATVYWTTPGAVLQDSATVNGMFTDVVPAAVSPYHAPVAASRFYRLRLP